MDITSTTRLRRVDQPFRNREKSGMEYTEASLALDKFDHRALEDNEKARQIGVAVGATVGLGISAGMIVMGCLNPEGQVMFGLLSGLGPLLGVPVYELTKDLAGGLLRFGYAADHRRARARFDQTHQAYKDDLLAELKDPDVEKHVERANYEAERYRRHDKYFKQHEVSVIEALADDRLENTREGQLARIVKNPEAYKHRKRQLQEIDSDYQGAVLRDYASNTNAGRRERDAWWNAVHSARRTKAMVESYKSAGAE